MSNDPDQIRAEIAQTRGDLSSNISTLADEMRPSTMVHRQTDKMRSRAGRLKDRIMGSASDTTSGMQSSMSSTADSAKATAQSALSSAEETVEHAPQLVREQTQGNPLAAGIVAFGVGMVVASLMPASEKEREAAAMVKEKTEPLVQEVTDTAKEMAGNLKEPAQQAAQSVKDTATEGAQQVRDQGKGAAIDVRDDAQEAAHTVRAGSSSGETPSGF
jgi:ElaB/YqjD/DUF883 family membrane-anchored ribosome-binding protein